MKLMNYEMFISELARNLAKVLPGTFTVSFGSMHHGVVNSSHIRIYDRLAYRKWECYFFRSPALYAYYAESGDMAKVIAEVVQTLADTKSSRRNSDRPGCYCGKIAVHGVM